jgi:NAD(P)-dependent dehydrogenase (short-subunit alcohol dehydrogenase family)
VFSLTGKKVLVSGAAAGLGQSIGDALQAAGAEVYGTSRTPESAKKIAERYDTSPVVLDVTDRSAIRGVIDTLWNDAGPIDLLCNNAGVNVPQPSIDVDSESWDLVLETNVSGAFFVTQAMARHWIAENIPGSVVSVGSQAGTVAIEERVAYGSSKAALAHMTRILALEWGPMGIRVNAIAPTFVRTQLTESTLSRPGRTEELVSRIPLGRLGMPADIAPAVVFLFSDEASLITGHILAIDGGYTIH